MTSEVFDKPRDLTVQEACAILNITSPTLYKLIGRGQIGSYKIGRARRINGESLQRFRNGGKRGAA